MKIMHKVYLYGYVYVAYLYVAITECGYDNLTVNMTNVSWNDLAKIAMRKFFLGLQFTPEWML